MTDRTPRYDTDGDDTIEADVDNQSLDTDELSIGSDGPATSFSDIGGGGGTADRTISSTSDLESLPSNIQSGETVRIKQPSTPYQPASWSTGGKLGEINVSNIELIFDTPFAADGNPVITIADNADIGGLIFGSGGTQHSDIIVDGMGFDGNHPNQDQTVKRLHAVTFENVNRAVCRNGFFTRTSPYHEHGSGGSAVTARKDSRRVAITDNYIFDIGDRGVQVAGTNIVVKSNQSRDGYDRTVSLNVTEPDGLSYIAKAVSVVGNSGDTNTDGSFIGCGGGAQRTGRGGFSIVGNTARGTHRSVVTLRDAAGEATVVGNVSLGGGVSGDPGLEVSGSFPRTTVVGNVVRDCTSVGIRVNGQSSIVGYNLVDSPAGAGMVSTSSEVQMSNNTVLSPGGIGIDWGVGDGTLAFNFVDAAGDQGLNLQNTANPYRVMGNTVRDSDQNGGGTSEIIVNSQNAIIAFNHNTVRNANFVFEGGGSNSQNLYIGNRGGDALANMFSSISADSWGYGNYPALATDEGTVTLTSGGSPAARIDGISGTEGYRPTVKVTPDPSASQPAADYSWEEYAEWDDSAGQWDLVVEWRTDPGSDVSAVYEATAEPTSRAVKNI